MDNDKKPHKIRGTNFYLVLMTALIIWYIERSAMLYHEDGTFFPELLTIGLLVYVLYELYSLLVIRKIKEGVTEQYGIIRGTYQVIKNWLNSKLPIQLPDTELDIEFKKQDEKENSHGGQTKQAD